MEGSDLSGGLDTGTAYGMKPATYNRNLVEVGPGTPMGELMRRYWQPCFTSADLTSEKPHKVRLLGEDLILFRDKQGRAGLVHEHCCHRGSSLYYGRIEEDGIRCCYHGWKFDAKGHCLDQPAEADGGRNRAKIRQPWYPVQERYGLIYAYMGPPEKKPLLPRWEHLENLGPDEIIEARAKPDYGPLKVGGYEMNPLPFNWLQTFENSMDGPHVPWLHYHHSGDQFGTPLMEGVDIPPYAFIENVSELMMAERTPLGVRAGFPMPGPGGKLFIARNEAMVPNCSIISGIFEMYYVVPMDDTHFLTFMLFRAKHHGEHGEGSTFAQQGKTWWEMTEDELRKAPSDFEAQSSIGALPAHNREHLTHGDIGLGMLRRRLEEAVRDVAEGRDPPGVVFDENALPMKHSAHGFIPFVEAAA